MFERLKEIRTHENLNQVEFAKSLGIGQSTLAMLEVGKRDILDRHIKTVCSIYNVNEHWLRTGEGEMFIKEDTFSLNEQARKRNLSELEISILKGYMDLESDERKQVIEMIKVMFPKLRDENSIAAENYRLELEAEKKGQILSASQKHEDDLSS